MDDLQFSSAKVDHVALPNWQDLAAPVTAPVVRLLVRVHEERFKLCIASDVITVSVCIQQRDRKVRQSAGNVPRSMNVSPGVYKKSALIAHQQEESNAAVLNTPGILIDLYDLVLHGNHSSADRIS